MLKIEKKIQNELSKKALESVIADLSVNSSVAGGILALTLLTEGGLPLGQTTFTPNPELDVPTSISTQTDKENDYGDYDEENND